MTKQKYNTPDEEKGISWILKKTDGYKTIAAGWCGALVMLIPRVHEIILYSEDYWDMSTRFAALGAEILGGAGITHKYLKEKQKNASR